MKHEIKKLENSAVEIKISLTTEEVSPIKNEVLAELASKAEVPGFIIILTPAASFIRR